MSKFEEYANKYKHVKMERRDGILQFTLHTNGGPVIWDLDACCVNVLTERGVNGLSTR